MNTNMNARDHRFSTPGSVVQDAHDNDARIEEPAEIRSKVFWHRNRAGSDERAKKEKIDPNELASIASSDGVWGKQSEDGPNYRNVGWVQSAMFLTNLQIGVGALALPATLHQIGLVPGVILIVFSGILTTWCDSVIGFFKIGHPEVYSIADVGGILAGRWGREVLGGMYWLFMILVGSGQLIAFSTALNAITDHATCTIVFVVVGAVLGIALGMVRTLDKMSWTMWVGLASIMAALIAAAAAAAAQEQPAGFSYRLFNNPGFLPGVQAGSNIILAFTGGPGFYGVLSEMKHTRDFNKSVLVCQGWTTITYTVISAVIYSGVGQAITSPALGSVSDLMKKVSYGLVIPGLVIGAVLYVHVPAKYVFVRAMRHTQHLTNSSWQHWTAWTACVVGTGILVFIFSLAIPVFNDLLTLISAICGTPLTVTLPSVMWIWETRRTRPASERGTLWWSKVALCFGIIALSLFISVAGTVAAVVSLNNAVSAGQAAPFSCADNSI